MRTILFTGGAGFIGSSLCEKLIEDPENFVVIVDNFSTGCPDKLPEKNKGRFRFIKCDVNNYKDISEVFMSYSFDYVFHYAAVVGVKRTQENPVMVLNDLRGIENILNLSKNSAVRRVFFSSSSEVYGEPVEFPQNEETTPLNSRIPYAIVKNVGEAFLKSYNKEFGLNYTIFRFFNTYGPKQSPDFVISRFIRMAIQNQPVTLYGDGMQTRTFCFIDDNVDATNMVFREACIDDNFPNEVINIGNDNETHIIDLAKLIISLTGSTSQTEELPPLLEGDMSRRLPDITKMKSLLQRELLPLDQGIQRILDNPSFIY
jgi:nucleoside-diphosphate-sugar epimerase